MITREQLLREPAYWTEDLKLSLFEMLETYRQQNQLSRKELADKLGYSKGYISQILNGNFDHRLSKLVELATKLGMVPVLKFETVERYMEIEQTQVLQRTNVISTSTMLNVNLVKDYQVQSNPVYHSSMESDNVRYLRIAA